MRLINADNLLAHKVSGEIGNLSGDFVPGFCIDREPTVDAVPRDEHEALLKRFRHLLKSNVIRSFDEYDPRTGTYKRDIVEADDFVQVVRCKDCACSAVDAFVKRRFCTRFGEVRPNGAVWGGIGVMDNHFCSYGRRRAGDSE